MRLRAHGLSVALSPGWEGRIFRLPQGEPTLHAADFALPAHDGEFGSRATADMPPGKLFIALTEYRPGRGLTPGQGLYAPGGLAPPVAVSEFGSARLLIARPGQTGLQRFFTEAGRPFCLYVVHRRSRPTGSPTPDQLAQLNALLGSLHVAAPTAT